MSVAKVLYGLSLDSKLVVYGGARIATFYVRVHGEAHCATICIFLLHAVRYYVDVWKQEAQDESPELGGYAQERRVRCHCGE